MQRAFCGKRFGCILMDGKPHLIPVSTADLLKKRKAVCPETAGDEENTLPRDRLAGECSSLFYQLRNS
jgi:hypothetical protein